MFRNPKDVIAWQFAMGSHCFVQNPGKINKTFRFRFQHEKNLVLNVIEFMIEQMSQSWDYVSHS